MSWVRFPGQTLVTGNVWGKSCTGGITLKNVLDLSVLHSYLNQINNKTLTPKKFNLRCNLLRRPCSYQDLNVLKNTKNPSSFVKNTKNEILNEVQMEFSKIRFTLFLFVKTFWILLLLKNTAIYWWIFQLTCHMSVFLHTHLSVWTSVWSKQLLKQHGLYIDIVYI